MGFLDDFKKEYEKQAARQGELRATPNHPEAKQRARLGGFVLMLIGLAVMLGSWWAWNSVGSIPVILLAAGPVLFFFGLFGSVTGKFPGQK